MYLSEVIILLLQVSEEGLKHNRWCSWVVTKIGFVWDDGKAAASSWYLRTHW